MDTELFQKRDRQIGLLPINMGILPPLGNQAYKLSLIKDNAESVLMDLISATIDWPMALSITSGEIIAGSCGINNGQRRLR